MQAARSSALFVSAISPLAPVHAPYKFNQSRRGAMNQVRAHYALSGSGMHRRDWWLINSRTSAAGRIHCEGSTK